MKVSQINIIAFCLLILGSFGCNKTVLDENFQVNLGHEYFPLEVGKYIVYEVDSIYYYFNDEIGGIAKVESSSQIREEIVDTLRDNIGRQTFIIHRFYRKNDSQPWQIKDAWTSLKETQSAEKVEENLRFVKMVFPVEEDQTWDGNLFVDEEQNVPFIQFPSGDVLSIVMFKNWSYSVLSKDSPDVIGGNIFDETLQIIQADDENLIEKRYSVEKYAKNVGLIYKEQQILDTQCISECIGQPWEDKAEKGFILRMNAIDFN